MSDEQQDNVVQQPSEGVVQQGDVVQSPCEVVVVQQPCQIDWTKDRDMLAKELDSYEENKISAAHREFSRAIAQALLTLKDHERLREAVRIHHRVRPEFVHQAIEELGARGHTAWQEQKAYNGEFLVIYRAGYSVSDIERNLWGCSLL